MQKLYNEEKKIIENQGDSNQTEDIRPGHLSGVTISPGCRRESRLLQVLCAADVLHQTSSSSSTTTTTTTTIERFPPPLATAEFLCCQSFPAEATRPAD